MIMVRVRQGQGEPVVGLLVHTQIMPMKGAAQPTVNARGDIVAGGPAQTMLQAFGVVAVNEGFIVAPMADMQPIFDTEEGQADDGKDAPAEEVRAEVRPGDEREGEGE